MRAGSSTYRATLWQGHTALPPAALEASTTHTNRQTLQYESIRVSFASPVGGGTYKIFIESFKEARTASPSSACPGRCKLFFFRHHRSRVSTGSENTEGLCARKEPLELGAKQETGRRTKTDHVVQKIMGLYRFACPPCQKNLYGSHSIDLYCV